jgi:alkylated DNA repair dioxygenase AlkB
VSSAEEAELLALVRALPLKEAQYLQYTARRRIVGFGGSYDFSSQELRPAGPIPQFLHPLRERIAALMHVPAEFVNHALVAEYQPGTRLGWHRDVPDFGVVGALSLLGAAACAFGPIRTGDPPFDAG